MRAFRLGCLWAGSDQAPVSYSNNPLKKRFGCKRRRVALKSPGGETAGLSPPAKRGVPGGDLLQLGSLRAWSVPVAAPDCGDPLTLQFYRSAIPGVNKREPPRSPGTEGALCFTCSFSGGCLLPLPFSQAVGTHQVELPGAALYRPISPPSLPEGCFVLLRVAAVEGDGHPGAVRAGDRSCHGSLSPSSPSVPPGNPSAYCQAIWR